MAFGFVNEFAKTVALAMANGFTDDIEMSVDTKFYDYLIQNIKEYSDSINNYNFTYTKNSVKWYGQNGEIKIKRKVKRNK